ncbi:hypothetical protein ACP4OV_003370 [Aristida adscensionis]
MTMRRRPAQASPPPRRRARRVLAAFLKLHREAGKPVEALEAARLEQMLRSMRTDEARVLRRALPAARRLRRPEPAVRHAPRPPPRLQDPLHGRRRWPGGGEGRLHVFEPRRVLSPQPLQRAPAQVDPPIARGPCQASMLWERVWPDALEKIMDMVARCPELQGEVRVPRERPLLWDAAPGGNAFSICSAKKLSRLRPCPSRCKKTTNWAPSDVLIRTFMGKRMLSLRGIERSMHPSNASSRFAAPCMKVEQIAPALHEANNGECGDMRIVLEKQDAAELARSLVTAI